MSKLNEIDVLNRASVMQTAMQGLWFKQVVASDAGGQHSLDMDQTTLADSVFNPADALRLMVWVRDGDCLGDEATAICEVPDELFLVGAVPTITREDWERALGRLSLCLFASMRNEWRRAHGRDSIEMENVLTAPDDFFALVASGFKHQMEH